MTAHRWLARRRRRDKNKTISRKNFFTIVITQCLRPPRTDKIGNDIHTIVSKWKPVLVFSRLSVQNRSRMPIIGNTYRRTFVYFNCWRAIVCSVHPSQFSRIKRLYSRTIFTIPLERPLEFNWLFRKTNTVSENNLYYVAVSHVSGWQMGRRAIIVLSTR